MDPRLEFTFQLLMDGTGLPRHQIMDHIFEGNMVSFLKIFPYFPPGLINFDFYIPAGRDKSAVSAEYAEQTALVLSRARRS